MATQNLLDTNYDKKKKNHVYSSSNTCHWKQCMSLFWQSAGIPAEWNWASVSFQSICQSHLLFLINYNVHKINYTPDIFNNNKHTKKPKKKKKKFGDSGTAQKIQRWGKWVHQPEASGQSWDGLDMRRRRCWRWRRWSYRRKRGRHTKNNRLSLNLNLFVLNFQKSFL